LNELPHPLYAGRIVDGRPNHQAFAQPVPGALVLRERASRCPAVAVSPRG